MAQTNSSFIGNVFGKEHIISFLILSLSVYGHAESGIPFCKGKKTGTPCKVDGTRGSCVFSHCVTALSLSRKVTIRVKYPEKNRYEGVDTSRMWIRGSGLGLSWGSSKEMKNISKDTWEYSINVQMGRQFINCSKFQGESMCGTEKIEFRIRSGFDKIDMLGANFVFSQFQSETTFSHRHSFTFCVYPWFFINVGDIKEESLFSPELNETREVQVFLPPSFKENVYKKYDIVFVNDGDLVRPIAAVGNLWKKMAIEATLKEFVLVGLKNKGTDGDRTSLLTPTNGTQMVCKHGTFKDGCGGCKFCPNCSEAEKMDKIIKNCTKWVATTARGEQYLDFIQYRVMSHASLRYRALSRQQNVGIMGYSLGGLISCHAAWTRPTVFGSAACMSPSLWWPLPLNAKFPDGVRAEFINKTLKHFRANRPLQKLYLDVGTLEDPPGPSLMLERVQLAARKIANTPFFEINKNLWLQVLDQEPHSGKAFIRRAWIPLQILYAPEGSARNTKTTNICALYARSYSASNKTAHHCQFLSFIFLISVINQAIDIHFHVF